MDADLVHARQLNRPVLGVDAQIVSVRNRAACGARAPEQVEVGLGRHGEIQRTLLPLDPQRDYLWGAILAWVNTGILGSELSGIPERILHRDLQPAERRRGKVNCVRAPQVEARRGRTATRARSADHVVRRHEVAAAHTEKTQRVAVPLERRIHVAEPHRAPARLKADKRVPISEAGRYTGGGVGRGSSLVEADALFQLADRFQATAKVPLSAEADVGVVDLHLPPVRDGTVSVWRRLQGRHGRASGSRPLAACVGELGIELTVDFPFVARLRVSGRRRERRPYRKYHRLSVQTHCLLLGLVIFQNASGHFPLRFRPPAPMFLHAEQQSLLRNICVASYPATAALSTKCKPGARRGDQRPYASNL